MSLPPPLASKLEPSPSESPLKLAVPPLTLSVPAVNVAIWLIASVPVPSSVRFVCLSVVKALSLADP